MRPPSELVMAAHAHTDQRARKSQWHPDPAVQAAGGNAAEHGTDVAAKGWAAKAAALKAKLSIRVVIFFMRNFKCNGSIWVHCEQPLRSENDYLVGFI